MSAGVAATIGERLGMHLPTVLQRLDVELCDRLVLLAIDGASPAELREACGEAAFPDGYRTSRAAVTAPGEVLSFVGEAKARLIRRNRQRAHGWTPCDTLIDVLQKRIVRAGRP